MAQNFIYLITHTDIKKNTIHVYSKKIQELNKGKSEIFLCSSLPPPDSWNFPKDTYISRFPSKTIFKTHPSGWNIYLNFSTGSISCVEHTLLCGPSCS